MSNMVGADIGELRDLAATFTAKAAQLKSIESNLNWRIHAAPWEGHDVSRFVQDWNTRHRKVILSASTTIANAAQDLLAHAQQQEQASTAGYTGGIASVVALRGQEAARVENSGPASWLASIGLAAIAFRQSVGTAHDLISKSLNVSLRAAEFLKVRALRPVAISSLGEKSAKELLKLVPQYLESTNRLYRIANAVDGKFLGPVGMALDAIAVGTYLGEKKYDMAAVSGVSLALGGAATLVAFGVITGPIVPFIAVGAAAWAVGSLVYENRETIGKGISWVGDKLSDARSAAWERVDEFKRSANQVLGNAARSVVGRITNPLRSVFG